MAIPVESVALIMAFAVDVCFGELPNRWHPVGWMGKGISLFCRLTPRAGKFVSFTAGGVLVGSGAALSAVIGWQIERMIAGYPFLLAALVQAIVLKQTFSVRALAGAARRAEAAIRRGDLPAARQQLAFHLVSRDVSQLSESQIAAATIESVAENSSDSIVAPLFYFAVAGLPGALLYRYVNTCDAMVGYRTERFEWLGKPAARFDDFLNLIPARLTAVLILAVSGAIAQQPRVGWGVWLRDRRATASPNAGQPMSAAAGVLGVELEKVGYYRLGRGQRPPEASDIGRAVRLLWGTAGMAAFTAVGWLICRRIL